MVLFKPKKHVVSSQRLHKIRDLNYKIFTFNESLFFLYSRYFPMQKHKKKIKIYVFETCGAISENFEHFQYLKSIISPLLYQAILLWLYFSKTRTLGLSFDIGLNPSLFFTLNQKLIWSFGYLVKKNSMMKISMKMTWYHQKPFMSRISIPN